MTVTSHNIKVRGYQYHTMSNDKIRKWLEVVHEERSIFKQLKGYQAIKMIMIIYQKTVKYPLNVKWNVKSPMNDLPVLKCKIVMIESPQW